MKARARYERILLEIVLHAFKNKVLINQVAINIFDSWCRTIRSIEEGSPQGGPFLFARGKASLALPQRPPRSRCRQAALAISNAISPKSSLPADAPGNPRTPETKKTALAAGFSQ